METDKDNLIQLLNTKELKAIEMKFEGFNMREIAEEIGEEYPQVRTWFSKNGKLYDYYVGYAKEETDKRRKEAHHTFKAHINNAVRTLVYVMNKSKLDIARVNAAKEIINRELGEPLKVIVNDESKVNEYLEAIKKLDNENISATDRHREDTNTA